MGPFKLLTLSRSRHPSKCGEGGRFACCTWQTMALVVLSRKCICPHPSRNKLRLVESMNSLPRHLERKKLSPLLLFAVGVLPAVLKQCSRVDLTLSNQCFIGLCAHRWGLLTRSLRLLAWGNPRYFPYRRCLHTSHARVTILYDSSLYVVSSLVVYGVTAIVFF